MKRGWVSDFVRFMRAYPGMDPRSLTMTQFILLVDSIPDQPASKFTPGIEDVLKGKKK